MCSVIGYILPNPKMKKEEYDNVDCVDNENISINSNMWNIFGHKFPKNEIVFFCQIIICYIIIIISLVCLVLDKPSYNDYLFTVLITTTLGYLLPNPQLNK